MEPMENKEVEVPEKRNQKDEEEETTVSGQRSQECCLAQTLRKDHFRDSGSASGHTLFLFQKALCTHKSNKLPVLPPLFVTSIWMGMHAVEDVVVHQAPSAQYPGPEERGGGWDSNEISGLDDNTPHAASFSFDK
ncbi:hypothetical protein PAMP_001194 [Pampus punctatissimus]